MDNKVNLKLEWSLWINWIAATTISFLINDSSQLFISNGSILAFLYALALDGLIIALFQWLFVLHYLIPNANKWMLVSAIGWGAGWLLGRLSGTALLVSLFINGTLLGIIQWAFFIRKLYSKSFLWVLINAIGLPFAYGLCWFVIFPLVLGNYNGPFSGQLDSAIRGILFGAITGGTLIWLSRPSRVEMNTITPSNPEDSYV
jgi:hypothetical protein